MSRIILDTETFKANNCRAVISTDADLSFSIQIFNRNKTVLGLRGKDHRKMEAVIDGLPIGKIQIINNEIRIDEYSFSKLTIHDDKQREYFRYTTFVLPHTHYTYRGLTKEERRDTTIAKANMGLYANQKLVAVMGGKNTNSSRLFSKKTIWVQPMRRFEPDFLPAVAVFFASTLLSISKLKIVETNNHETYQP